MRNFETRRIALAAILGALITVQQYVLQWIPNVSFTAFFIIVFAMMLDRKTNLMVIVTYLISRNILFGSPHHIWMLYIIVFGGLSIFVSLFKTFINNIYILCIIGFITGFAVGVVSAFTYVWVGGMDYVGIIPYIVRGIPFDLVHGGSNVVIIIFAYDPVSNIVKNQNPLNRKGV